MNINRILYFFIISMTLFTMIAANAGTPVWTFSPILATTFSVAPNSTAAIKYQVTNQSQKSHTLVFTPMQGITQVTTGAGICNNPFTLSSKGSSCVLYLKANGNQIPTVTHDGPIVCQQGSSDQCYRPSAGDILNITQGLPSNCVDTGDNNIACTITIDSQTNFGFTNMSYALCRSAQCDYTSGQSSVTCNCELISANQGVNSASVSPLNYNSSKPVGNNVVSTYSMVNSSGETPTNCPSGPFANCFGAPCTVSGSNVTCTCPVSIDTYIAPFTNCTLTNKIWSATSVSSFPSIEGAMLDIYNEFYGGDTPSD